MQRLARFCILMTFLVSLTSMRPLLAADAKPRALTLLFSSDLNGALEPCGCPGSPSGGFPRRVTAVSRIRTLEPALLLADTGNALLPTVQTLTEHPDKQAARLMMRLLARQGVHAMAVGARDLWFLSPQALLEEGATRLPWLSVNVASSSGKLLFPPARVVTLGGLKVGFLGVTEASDPVARKRSIKFLDPVTSARAQAALLRPQVDLVVALSNLPEDGLTELQTVRELDVILTGTPENSDPRREMSSVPYVFRAPAEGRGLGRVDLVSLSNERGSWQRSASLEKRQTDLERHRDALEQLRARLIREEGRLDPRVWQDQSAHLRERIAALEATPTPAGPARELGFHIVPLPDAIPEDVPTRALIQTHAPAASAGDPSPPPATPAPAKPGRQGAAPR